MKKILPTLALCLLFASCNQNSMTPSGGQTNQSDQTQSPDWQLTAKVKEAILADGSLSPSNRFVSVSTMNGVVVLTGTVSDKEQMRLIVKKAESISGVKKVDNQMMLSNS